MDEKKYDHAATFAKKAKLGDDKVNAAAEKWYMALMDGGKAETAIMVAVNFNLSPDKVRRAEIASARATAREQEREAYQLLEAARQNREQADSMERGLTGYTEAENRKARFETKPVDKTAFKEEGLKRYEKALAERRPLSAQHMVKIYGLDRALIRNVALMLYEDELRGGNELYAQRIAKDYKISEADRKAIAEIVMSDAAKNAAESDKK